MKKIIMIAIFATLAATISNAETIRPDINVPLRDAAICRGPSGEYYLTGTIAPTLPHETSGSFHNCHGVYVWKSINLKEWQDVGFIWDIRETEELGRNWQVEMYPVAGWPSGIRANGMISPRLTCDGERFWIAYSMNGYGVGVMPGSAGVDGTYLNTYLAAEAGGSPTGKSDGSVFVDHDGTHYLVWGGGCVAKLKSAEELAKLKDNEVGIEGPVHYLPLLAEDFFKPSGPDRGAPYGAFLFHDGSRYHYLFTATTLRNGRPHEDAYICSSESLFGPYSSPELCVLDAGRCSAFQGPEGPWKICHSDVDDRPRIIPLPTEIPRVDDKPQAMGPVTIAKTVPPRPAALRPEGIPQIVEMIEPCIEQPLRDGAICQGPEGEWYLTGTEGALTSDGAIDWSRNNGIHLWISTDRKNWEDLGYIWDIDRDAPQSSASAWQLQAHLDLACGAVPRVGRAMTAPEFHYLNGTFYIVYSMNGSGIGILKNTSGKATGPYEDSGKIVAHGRDGSLFQDGNDVYLVWGQGFYAKLNDDLTALDSPVQALFTNVQWYPRYKRRPEMMGIWGSGLAKQGDTYIWTFTTRTGRGGINAIDTMLSWSKSLKGPWGEPCLMALNGGQSTLIPDGNGGWLATVSGEDEYSQCPYQTALTPVVGNGRQEQLRLSSYRKGMYASQWPAAHSLKATELDLWIGYPELLGPDTELRDVFVTLIDGTYYATGTSWGDGKKYFLEFVLFRSDDLIHWERMEDLYHVKQLAPDGMMPDLAEFEKVLERHQTSKSNKDTIKMGETHFYKLDGHFYAIWHCNGGPGIGTFLLKSEGDDPGGPYKAVVRVGLGDFFENDDGKLLWISPSLWIAAYDSIAEFVGLPRNELFKAGERIDIVHEERPYIHINEDCEMGLQKINGKYVFWSTDWTGGYDCNYIFADDWRGPYRGKIRIIPHGGNGSFFQDKKGDWWYAYMSFNYNEWTLRSTKKDKLNFIPLHAGMEDGELILEPKAMRANRERINKMGALWHRAE